MSTTPITCTSWDCPERHGGMCIIASYLTDRLTAEEVLFLSESNNIEDVWDTDSLLQAIEAWEYLKTAEQLTPAVIRAMHGILMRNQDLQPKDRSAFRTCRVWIGGREGKPWYAVPALVDQWVVNANDLILNGKNDHPQTVERIIKGHHVVYETIHPFVDGNGRTGRHLMNWQRLRVGLPILVIKEAEKWAYYLWFREYEASKGGENTMGKITIEFDSSRRYEVVNAYNAIEGVLKGYGYVTEIVTVPADNTAPDGVTEATTPSAEETPADQPAAPVEPTAPDAAATDQPVAEEQAAPVDPAAPDEQIAPDAAAPAETPADQQPQ